MPRLFAAAAATLAFAAAAPALAPAQPAAAPAACTPGAKLQFICGFRNVEDLVLVPGTNWIIGSGLAVANTPGTGGLVLIDADKHAASKVSLPAGGQAKAPFAACPAPLDPARFSAHGLNILPQGKDKARLFVVGHGAREAVEVFDVVSGKGAPSITWAGCIPAPAGASINSVTALPDGHVIATDFYHAPLTMQDALAGKNTGAVYAWAPGAAGFGKLAGTDLPGPNGVEVTRDGKYLLVAVTGTSSVMRYDLKDTAKPPQVLKTEFRTDNLRWGPGGKLLLAGPGPAPDCTPSATVRCGMAPAVGSLDPATMKLTEVYRGPVEPTFQGLSSALIVGKTLWLGSYMSDRVAYTPLGR